MCRGDSNDINRDAHDAGEACPSCADKSEPPEGQGKLFLHKFIHYNCLAATSKLKYAFRMALRLEDYTGVVTAYLVDEDAVSCTIYHICYMIHLISDRLSCFLICRLLTCL